MDPEGPKTCGSGGSGFGSATLLETDLSTERKKNEERVQDRSSLLVYAYHVTQTPLTIMLPSADTNTWSPWLSCFHQLTLTHGAQPCTAYLRSCNDEPSYSSLTSPKSGGGRRGRGDHSSSLANLLDTFCLLLHTFVHVHRLLLLLISALFLNSAKPGIFISPISVLRIRDKHPGS